MRGEPSGGDRQRKAVRITFEPLPVRIVRAQQSAVQLLVLYNLDEIVLRSFVGRRRFEILLRSDVDLALGRPVVNTLGLREQLIFPEIEYDKIDKIRGMEITIVTNAPSDDQAAVMLQMLGMPFRKG